MYPLVLGPEQAPPLSEGEAFSDRPLSQRFWRALACVLGQQQPRLFAGSHGKAVVPVPCRSPSSLLTLTSKASCPQGSRWACWRVG